MFGNSRVAVRLADPKERFSSMELRFIVTPSLHVFMFVHALMMIIEMASTLRHVHFLRGYNEEFNNFARISFDIFIWPFVSMSICMSVSM
jgi:hypothetical protein